MNSDSRYVMTLNEAQELLEQILNDMPAETKSGQPTARRSSGAPSENIPRTLENFGYSDGGRFVDYSTTEVVNELSAGNYVLISGFSYRTTTKSSILGIPINDNYKYSCGHQWLAHGLMTDIISAKCLIPITDLYMNGNSQNNLRQIQNRQKVRAITINSIKRLS